MNIRNLFPLVTFQLLSLSLFAQDKPPTPVSPGNDGSPPSDAIVLFNGKDFSEWQKRDGSNPGWKLENGAMTVVKGTGDIFTKRKFTDLQLHIEWKAPKERKGEGQYRGNSGIFMQDKYEVQVLDCWENKTFANGQAGSVFGQYAPLVNPCFPSGEWQTYDIIFHAPRFNSNDSTLIEKGRITIFMNGVLIQDNVEIQGRTDTGKPVYEFHEAGPIRLQDHNDGIEPSISYRNIWARELE